MNETVRILIVDDQEADFDLARHELLENLGDCRLEQVQTRQELLHGLAKFKPDVIISEYKLENFSGLEGLNLAKQLTPLTPLIIWSRINSEEAVVECLNSGAGHYLEKDHLKRLVPTVKSVLKNHRLLQISIQDEQNYRRIFENSPDGFFQSTPEGRFINVNPAMSQMFGYSSPQTMLESVTDIASQIYAEPLDRQALTNQLKSDDQIVNIEVRSRHKDGSIFWTSTSARTVRDASGQVLFYEGFIRDITERKRAELERQALLEIMQGLADSNDLQAFLRLIHQSIEKVIYAKNFFVVFHNKSTGLFEEIYSVDQYDPPAPPSRLEKSITSYVFRTGTPLIMSQALFEELSAQGEVELVGTNSASWLGAPLKTANGTIGVIAVQDYETPGRYSEHDMKFLASIGSQTALAIERKQVEEKLQSSENRYRLATRATKDVIWEWDLQTHQLIWSDNAQFAFGYSINEIGPDETWWDERIHPDDHTRVFAKLDAIIKSSGGADAWADEYRFRHKDGSYIEISDHAYIERDAKGQVTRMIGAMADITENKQAELKLRENEERYRYLFENNPHPMWVYDLKTLAFLAVNDSAIKKYGYSRFEFLSMTISDIRPTEEVDRLRKHLEQARPDQQNSGEWRHQLKDGSLIDVEITSHTLTLNGRAAALVVAQDVTGKKLAEEKIRAQESRFRSLIENSLDHISLLNADGTLLWENPSTNRNLGYEQDEFVGRNIFELMHPDDQSWAKAMFAKLVSEHGASARGTFRLKRRSGEWRWIEAIAANMLDDSNVQAVVINYRDVTKRQQAELELQQKNDDLALLNTINESVIRGESLNTIARLLATEMKLIFSSEGNTIYLLSPDKQSALMQQFFIAENVKRKIEEVLGGTIPLVQIPLKEGSYFHKVVNSRQGIILKDPQEIQKLMFEFSESPMLPRLVRGPIRKLFPQLLQLLQVKSTILVPLMADGEPIGIMDISSRNEFSENDLKRIESLSRQLTVAFQRQQADEKVRRSETFLHSVQNALSAHIAILDENGMIIQVNAAWRKFAEQNRYEHPEHGVGLNYLEICDQARGQNAEETPWVARAILDVLSGQKREAQIEYPCHSLDEKRWFSLRVTKFTDGDQVRVVLAHEDATERKLAEETIREGKLKYQNLVETSHDLIWSVDAEGRFTYLNQAAQEIYGYKPEELIGRLYFEVMDTQDPHGSPEKFKEAIAHVDEFKDAETYVRNRNGDLIILSANSVVIRDENGQAIAVSGSSRNITERKQAEGKLRESEERYRALFEDSPVSIWEEDFSEVKKYLDSLQAQGVTDLRSYFTHNPEALLECSSKIKILDVNNTALQLYSANNKAHLIESTLINLSMGEQEHNLQDFIAIATGQLGNGWEGGDEKLTGEPIEISLRWSVVPGHEHDYARVIVTVTDITARKRAERELRESEERYRVLIAQLPAIVYTDSPEQGIGITKFVSPQIEKILGFTPQEWTTGGFNLWETQIHPEDRETVLATYEASLKKGEPFKAEYRIRRKNGEMIWVLDQSSMTVDAEGQPHSLHGIVYDITENKLAEKNLQESEERFASAFEYAPIGKALVSLEGQWLKVNPALRAILGYSADEIIRFSFSELTHPDDFGADRNYIAQLLSGQINTYQIEKRCKHQLGHYVWVLVSVSLIRAETGEPLYFIEQVQDITERRYVEENNRRRLSELEALYENGIAINQLLDPKLICLKVADVLSEKLNWHHVVIRLYDAETHRLEVNALKRPDFKHEQLQEEVTRLNSLVSSPDQGLTGWALKQRAAVRKSSLQDDPRYLETYPGMQSGLYVPILAGERALGAISVESEVERAFTEQDERLLTTLSNQAAIAIENAQLYMMVQQELSERQQAEVRLRESEARQNGIIEAAMDGIITVDESQNIVLFNAAAEKIFGYPARDAIGKPLETFVPHRYRMAHREHINRFGETGVTTRNMNALGEVSGLRMDGSEFPLEASISQIVVAGVKLYTIILRDITERKQSVEALRASEEKFRLLAEELEIRVNERTTEVQDLYNNAPCGYHSLDADGNFVRINQTELDWLGYTREEIIGLPFKDFLTPDGRAAFVDGFAGFKQRGSVKDLELDLLRKDGSLIPVVITATATYDQSGEFATSRSTLFDNTERKYALETLRLANSEMKRALRTKDEFLANMSHELRTPLNAILGLSESLLEQTAGPLNERQNKYLSTVNESGHHLLELINDILDLAKIEAGQIALTPGKVDVKSACQASLRLVQQLAKKKDQSIEVEIDDEVGYLWADERRLKQMLVNLLSNAVKFTPEHGKLGLIARLDQANAKVLITIWDHGIGIREEDLTRLFQPFVQLDSSLARESSGTGLGLALVAQMARLHGGSVSVTSELGQGSRFTVTLPWEAAVTEDTLEKFKITGRFPIIRNLSGEKQTILIVEDTDSVVMLIRDYLELSGYHVMVARDGLNGITQAVSVHPDLILMDVQMPGMDGLEATRRMRREASLSNTPIIALTALAMPSDRAKCIEAGMNDYLSKPVNLRELVKTIQTHLPRTGRSA